MVAEKNRVWRLPDIKRIMKLLPDSRQTLFFSATMPKDVRQLANKILKNPITVQIGLIAPAKTGAYCASFNQPTGQSTDQPEYFAPIEIPFQLVVS